MVGSKGGWYGGGKDGEGVVKVGGEVVFEIWRWRGLVSFRYFLGII
jgi:hypothetical protein